MNSVPTFQTLAEAFTYCRDMDASLAERLDAFNDATRYLLPGYQEAVDRLVARLKSAETGSSAPKPGEIMPAFILPDEEGRLVSLKNLLATGPVAVVFHRGHWCPYCRINTQRACRGAGRDRPRRRSDRCDHARPRAVRDDLQDRGECAIPGADGHGQRLCACAQSGDLGRGRDAIDLGGRKPATADLPRQRILGDSGARCLRCAEGRNHRRRVSSIRIIDGAWPSKICSRASEMLAVINRLKPLPQLCSRPQATLPLPINGTRCYSGASGNNRKSEPSPVRIGPVAVGVDGT